MKKIIIIILLELLISACTSNTARSTVEKYLKKYNSLDSEVLVSMENIIKEENLSSELEEKYREVLKKQYKDLKYEIIEEEYDDTISYITVKVKVYDLYGVIKDADEYLENNRLEFYDENGAYSVEKFNSFKLDKMREALGRVEYTIIFTVTKKDGKYEIMQPTEDDLLKIHGIYNYDI